MPGLDAAGLENVWTISSPTAGTVVTANYCLGVASNNAIVGVYNVTGNKALYLKRAVVVVVSGTMVTGNAFVWGVAPATQAVAITSTGATGAINNLTFLTVTHNVTNGPFAQPYAGDTTSSVLAGTTANSVKMLRPFGGGAQGALPTGGQYTLEEYVDGEIQVNPGCFAGLFCLAGSTGLTVLAALTWGEGA